jgi:hypothetical protein
MVDIATLALSHGLLAFAAWRLLWRDDLDKDEASDIVIPTKPWLKEEPMEGEQADA